MSRISQERKESLLRRYGSKTIDSNAVTGGMKKGGPGGTKPGGPGPRRSGGFGRPGPMRGISSFGKPRNASAIINRLLSYIGRDRVKILFVFACVLVSSLAGLGGTYVLRPVINNLVSAGFTAEEKIRSLVTGLLVMAGIYLVGVTCTYLQQRIMIRFPRTPWLKSGKSCLARFRSFP